jgi:predicted HAD superfamily Cof-like phosphohydrolase
MIDFIEMWHQRARPKPTSKDFHVQLGCHFEEVAEMLETFDLRLDEHDEVRELARQRVAELAVLLKIGHAEVRMDKVSREDMLDAIADQVVTATGVGHCAGMQVTEAVRRVNHSNWSKFDVDGKPLYDKNGKVLKGPNYAPPDLGGLY